MNALLLQRPGQGEELADEKIRVIKGLEDIFQKEKEISRTDKCHSQNFIDN